MKRLTILIAICIMATLCAPKPVHAQSDKPYTDGTVWMVQYVQTKSGMSEVYLKDLSEHWVKVMKAAQSRDMIMDYTVLSAVPASNTDWDLMLLIEVKNYAALDGLDDKMDALAIKLLGSEDTQHQSAISRNDMRDVLGGKLAREVVFK